MSLLADELLGRVRPKLRGARRTEKPLADEREVRAAKRKSAISRRNRRMHVRRKQDPVKYAAWQSAQAKWRRDNPTAMSSYRAAYVMRNPERHKAGQLASYHRNKKLKGLRRGEAVSWSKLTAAIVRAARARYAAGEATIAQLAAEAGVTYKPMWKALNGITWAHVE